MILAIETATEICSAALVQSGKIISHRSINEKNIHSEQLMVLIDKMVHESNISKNAIRAVAVSIGPGSFTGLRIGLSSAKGFALALNIPLIPVPTLDGLAEEYRENHFTGKEAIFCSLIDAKRNEAFYCFYKIFREDVVRLTEYAIKNKEEIFSDAENRQAIIEQPRCNAAAIGIFAERKQKELSVTDFSFLEPLYLREFVTTVSKK